MHPSKDRFDFRKRPAFYSAIAMITGILATGVFLKGASLAAGTVCLIGFGVSMYITSRSIGTMRVKTSIFLSIFFILGAGVVLYHEYAFAPEHLKFLELEERKRAVLTAVVDEEPLVRPEEESERTWPKKADLRLLVQAELLEIENKPRKVSGQVMVYVYDHLPEIRYGDLLRMECRIGRPVSSGNPGSFDYAAYLRAEGIYLVAYVSKSGDVRILDRDAGAFLPGVVAMAKRRLRNVLYEIFDRPHADLLAAILLGYREALDSDKDEMYERSGTRHLLAISGLHIMVFAGFLFFALWAVGFPRRVIVIAVMVAVLFYAAMAGPRPSVIRAATMSLLFLTGELLMRSRDSFNLLGLAAIVILFFNPGDIYNPGFQLSFAAVLGIVAFYGAFERYFQDRIRFIGRLQDREHMSLREKYIYVPLAGGAYVSIAAFLATAPLTLYHFHIFAPMAIFVNVVVYPFIWLVVTLGFLALFGGVLWIGLGKIFAIPAALAIDALEGMIGAASGLNLHVYFADQSVFKVLYAYALILLALFGHGIGVKARHVAALILIGVVASFAWDLATREKDRLEVTFLDVGDGVCVYLEFPGGHNMLYDCGTHHTYDAGGRTAAPFIWNRGRRDLDVLVLSHGDWDHCGGVPGLLESIRVKKVFTSPWLEWGSRAGEVIEAVRENSIEIVPLKSDDRLIGLAPDVIVEVLYPLEGPFPSSRRCTNDTSVVLRISAFGKSVLLTGDAEEITYAACKYAGVDLSADVVLVPHHGGKMDFAEEFARMVGPSYAVASSRYENPASLAIYQRLGAKVFSTRKSGAVTFSITRDGVDFREHRNNR